MKGRRFRMEDHLRKGKSRDLGEPVKEGTITNMERNYGWKES